MKALVLCLADPTSNPRPNRMIHLLNGLGFSVDALGFAMHGELPLGSYFVVEKPSRALTARALRFGSAVIGSLLSSFTNQLWPAELVNELRYRLKQFQRPLKSEHYDLLVVENLELLPLAFRVRNFSIILFDVREYFPREYESSIRFRLLERPLRLSMCKQYLPQCDHMVTVSPGLAEEYEKEFGVSMQVLRSTPKYRDMPVHSTSSNAIRLVYHGGASPDRNLKNLIEITLCLDDRFTLDLYLVGSPRYIRSLKVLAAGCNRIRFLEPVPFDQIVPMLNQYDVGFFYVEPTSFNLLNCLPNKLFEFIQARLAVAIGPSPNMAELVHEYNCGFIAPEFSLEAMIETLQSLTPEMIDRAKHNSDVAARELCWERESGKLVKTLKRLLPNLKCVSPIVKTE
jgi:hypothetical protein